jgi:hypothetical protein
MTPTSDGGYIIATACTPFLLGEGSNNAFVLKTDSSGKMQWSKTHGGSGIDFFSLCNPNAGKSFNSPS